MLDSKVNVHLGDLGCSTNKNIASTVAGTPSTMAPEI